MGRVTLFPLHANMVTGSWGCTQPAGPCKGTVSRPMKCQVPYLGQQKTAVALQGSHCCHKKSKLESLYVSGLEQRALQTREPMKTDIDRKLTKGGQQPWQAGWFLPSGLWAVTGSYLDQRPIKALTKPQACSVTKACALCLFLWRPAWVSLGTDLSWLPRMTACQDVLGLYSYLYFWVFYHYLAIFQTVFFQ